MSIPVDLERLRDELARYGMQPYLLTVTADARPHAVAVSVVWDGDALVTAVGNRTAANARERPDVTLLWPPHEVGGYSLIVDATATVAGDGGEVRLRPAKGVQHRPALSASGGDQCGSDCVPLAGPAPADQRR